MSAGKGPTPGEQAILDAVTAMTLRLEENELRMAQSLGGVLLRGARAVQVGTGGTARASFADGSLVGFALRETSGATAQAIGIGVQNPAAGAEWSYTVPAGSLLKISGIAYTLTTSAVVGARLTTLQIKDPGGVVRFQEVSPNSQPASTTTSYQWGPFGGPQSNNTSLNLPDNLTLGPGWTITTSTAARDAGDQYTAVSILAATTDAGAGATVEIRAHDAAGDLLVPISVPPGATVREWFAGGGISFADGLAVVVVSGSVDGAVFLRGRDE